MLDEKGIYVRWNNYQRDKIIGKPNNQVAKMNAIVTIHPEDRALVGAKIKSVLNGKDKIVEGRVLMRGGPEFKWILMTGHRILIENKPYLVGTGIDITERKKAEIEIRKFSQAIDSAYDSIIFTDLKGNTIYVNDPFLNTFGYSKHEMSKVSIFNLSEKSAKVKMIFEQIAKKGFWKGAVASIKKNGNVFPSVLNFSMIKDSEGNKIGTMGIIRDITHEKEIDNMKTELVSLTSHQLRTPLTSIKWNLELILNGSAGQLNKTQESRLKDISQSNQAMIDLVNSFLNISRMESGKLNVEPKSTELGLLFKTAVSNLQPQIEKAKLKIIENISANLPKLSIDPQLISNVYLNLLNNSIKYTLPGGFIEISIVINGDFLVSSVKDSGFGIPTNEQGRIFERFFRGSNVTRSTAGSTGLGLYLAKEIVKISGEKIWFKSLEDKGSTFSFSLPLKGSLAKKGEVSLSP